MVNSPTSSIEDIFQKAFYSGFLLDDSTLISCKSNGPNLQIKILIVVLSGIINTLEPDSCCIKSKIR